MKRCLLVLASMFVLMLIAVHAYTTETGNFQTLSLPNNDKGDFTNPARVSIDVDRGVIYITVIGNGRIINVIKEVKIGTP